MAAHTDMDCMECQPVPQIIEGKRNRADYYRRIKLPRDHPDWWPAGLTPLEFFDICGLYLSLANQNLPQKIGNGLYYSPFA